MCTHSLPKKKGYYTFSLYIFIFIAAFISGYSHSPLLNQAGLQIAHLFTTLFQWIALPILSLSIIVTLANLRGNHMMRRVGRYALSYTLGTTLIAATISCLLYCLIKPEMVPYTQSLTNHSLNSSFNAFQTGLNQEPNGLFDFIARHQVLIILGGSILISIILLLLPDSKPRDLTYQFFLKCHQLLMKVTHWVIFFMPIGLYGFLTSTILQLRDGMPFRGIGEYLLVIVLANVVQGSIILPLWLKLEGIPAWKTFKGMFPALSIAFFSKSSVGTLPITMKTAENQLKINPKISRFVLPLCTSLNMNGCAAFIFATVVYLMQNHGIELSVMSLIFWIFISSLTAIGNAGVPMGCFFLSASLLVNMNVPITLLGIILPFYTLIDMLETGLNVWSDSCVARVVHEKLERHAKN